MHLTLSWKAAPLGTVFNTWEIGTDFKLLVLRGSILVLLFWQASGTGLHGNSDAHAAASDGHVGDARPFISLRAVTLDAGQEAVLVKTSWTDTHRHNV